MNFRPVKPRGCGTVEEALGRVVDACGGVKRAAFAIGKSPTQTYAYTDPQAPDQITVADALRLEAASRSAAFAELFAAAAGGFFSPVEASEESFGRLMAREERAHGRALALICEGIARREKGELLAGAEPELRRSIRDMIGALVAADAKLGE